LTKGGGHFCNCHRRDVRVDWQSDERIMAVSELGIGSQSHSPLPSKEKKSSRPIKEDVNSGRRQRSLGGKANQGGRKPWESTKGGREKKKKALNFRKIA